MHTPTLFTLIFTIFLSLFTTTYALPAISDTASVRTGVIVAAKTPATLGPPRSLLGRTYLRHNLALSNTLSRAVLPLDDEFSGRVDRFHARHRRRAALTRRSHAEEVDSSNHLLSNQTMVAPKLAAAPEDTHKSMQVQAPMDVATATAGSQPIGIKHYAPKKSTAAANKAYY